MTAVKLEQFGGMLPSWDDRLLPPGQSSYCRDAYLYSGALTGWRQPKLLRQLNNSAAQFVYRLPNNTTRNTVITAPDSIWLEFNDPDTTVMHSPVVQDSFQRYYTASPSQQPMYNTYDRIVAGQSWWILGVPASGCAPGVTITGGGDTVQLGFPTIGVDASGNPITSSTYVPGNAVALVPIVPQGSMLIQDVSFIPASTDLTANITGVVYSDLNGKPYQLLGESVAQKGMTLGTTIVCVFTNGVPVISDVKYWVGIATDKPYYMNNADANNSGVYLSHTYSNGPPPSINTSAVISSSTFQMWADLLGSSVYTARAYVYTWVTAYGEEGPPSPPSLVNGWSNGVWNVSLFSPDPADMGVNRNITSVNIYRSITNQAGVGTYFFVANVPVGTLNYQDTIPDNTVALNQQLVSLYWFEPPSDLQAIKAFPNGISVGFRSNEVWFSEAYRPHAWPPGYVLTTEFPIVGIGIAGQAIIVCTESTPYLINGINPSAMALTKINLLEPCLHRGSIISTDTTVLYVSQNGLMQISQSGAGSNITEGWISRERWQQLTPQADVRAIKHMTSYFAFGTPVTGAPLIDGYTVELSQEDQTSFTIWPQAGGHRLGFEQLSSPNGFGILNVESDPWTGVAMLVQNGAVYYYDFTDQAPTIVPYKWRSKVYQQLSRKNFAALRVWFTVPPSTPSQLPRVTTDPQPMLGPNQYALVRVYTDGNLWTTREVQTSGELLRIYSGQKVEQWQFEIEGRINISNLQVATSVKELGLV